MTLTAVMGIRRCKLLRHLPTVYASSKTRWRQGGGGTMPQDRNGRSRGCVMRRRPRPCTWATTSAQNLYLNSPHLQQRWSYRKRRTNWWMCREYGDGMKDAQQVNRSFTHRAGKYERVSTRPLCNRVPENEVAQNRPALHWWCDSSHL